MGTINITSIKRRQLTSSVVGTPGVDTGTAQALNSLANSSFQIGNQIKRNQEPANQVEAVKVSQDLDVDFQTAEAELRAKYEADLNLPLAGPGDVTYEKEVKALEAKRRIEGLGGIKNKRVRQLVSLDQQRNKVKKVNTSLTWARDEQILRAKNNLDISNDRLAVGAGLLNSLDEFKFLVKTEYVKAFDAAKGILSKEAMVEYEEKAIRNGLTNYINSRITKDPEAMKLEFDNVQNQLQDFGRSFDSKEIDAFRTKISNSIEGKNVNARVNAKLFVSGAIKVVTDKDTPAIADYEALKVQLDNTEQLTAPRRLAIDNIITNIHKVNKATASNVEVNERVVSDLEKRFNASADTLDEDTGVVKNLEEAMDENIDLTIDIEDAFQAGQIRESDRRGWIVPLEEAIEAATSEQGEMRSDIEKFTDELAVGAVTAFKVGKSLISYFTKREQDPTTLGLNRVNDILETRVPDVTDRRFKDLKGKLRRDLRQEIMRDRRRGIDITEESVQQNINKIFKEGATRYRFPDISSDGDVSLLDPFTGRRFNPNTLEMIS